MQVFSNKNQKLTILKEKPFKLEKEIQLLFETNLDIIGNLNFVKSEFNIKDYRIDSLAYDISQITYKTQTPYNQIAKDDDKL